MNLAILIGRLGADPKTRVIEPTGLFICELSLPTNKKTGKGDDRKEHTEWHRVTVFGTQGELCAKWLKKGSRVAVRGEIRYSRFEKDGVTRYSTSIVADHVEFLGEKTATTAEPSRDARPDLDDLPF